MTNVPAGTNTSTGGASNSMGVEIITPSAAAKPADANGGLKAVGPTGQEAPPPIEKAARAPDQVNDVPAGSQPPAQAPRAHGKQTKPELDKGDQPSSNHHNETGLRHVP